MGLKDSPSAANELQQVQIETTTSNLEATIGTQVINYNTYQVSNDSTEPFSFENRMNCENFEFQEDAQSYFDAKGGSRENNVDDLDRNHDGVACEDRPRK